MSRLGKLVWFALFMVFIMLADCTERDLKRLNARCSKLEAVVFGDKDKTEKVEPSPRPWNRIEEMNELRMRLDDLSITCLTTENQ